MEQYIARELKEDIKFLIKRIIELNEKIEKMDDKNNKIKTIGDYPIDAKPDIRLFDKFDWAAIGLAATAVVLLIAIITGNY